MISTIEQAMGFIYGTSWKGSVLGLERISELMRLVGEPQKKLKFVHIAGTNGKGSTAAMTASVLTAAGYKTGLYTSPYIEKFGELIQVDGVAVTDDELVLLCAELQGYAAQMADAPTEYEIITALAFLHFERQKCDIVVLEVGMGGRLDSTNVIDSPEVAVITAIGLDHMAYLGGTVEKIAGEKAGIIKGGPVVCHPQTESVARVIREKCAAVGSDVVFIDEHAISLLDLKDCDALENLEQNLPFSQVFYYKGGRFSIPLLGGHQLKNAAVVIEIIEILRLRGWEVSNEALLSGLASTRWPYRFEIMRKNPALIIDVAHNPQGISSALDTLQKYFPGKKFIFIFGVLADKAFKEMAELLAPHAKYIFLITPENPRALPAHELAKCFSDKKVGNSDYFICESIPQGIQRALDTAAPDDVICALGSLSLVGTIRSLL